MISRVTACFSHCGLSPAGVGRILSAFLVSVRLDTHAERVLITAGVRLLIWLILIPCGAAPLRSGDRPSGDREIQAADFPKVDLLSEIRKASRDRQERVHSLKLIWVNNVFETGEGQSRLMSLRARVRRMARPPRNGAANASAEAQPNAVDTRKSLLCLLAFRGTRYRDEFWQTKTESDATALLASLHPGRGSEYAVILDGKLRTGLVCQGTDVAGNKFRELTFQSGGPNWIAMQSTGAILLRLYRSADPALGRSNPTEGTKLTLVPPRGEQPAAVVASFPKRELWLDPTRDYVVLKDVSFDERHHPLCETVCEYQKAPPPIGWLPEKWTTTWGFSDGVVHRRSECRLVSWSASDADVSEDLFHFACPDGTFLIDQTQNQGQLTKSSIMWHGVRFPVTLFRTYAESLELVKAMASE